ncbi:MAG: SDR family oxidoreductase [Acidobacteriota bacterium]|nr:SDR family oxidoreductase [Acidobacteriota bacterium]
MPTAIVTGASSGIGREFAYECAREGYDVVLVARSENALQAIASDLRSTTGRTVHVLAKDLSDPSTPREIFEETSAFHSDVEILINNAGFGLLGRFWELSETEQMEMLQVNIAALTHLLRLFLPGMIERRRGRILNVASTAAFQPGPLMAVYYATKSYVVSFSEALHNEARDHGLTVTVLCPGPTNTDFVKRAGMTKTKLFSSGHAMSAAEVARIGYQAMKRGQPLVVAGKLNGLMAFLTRFAPIQFTATMARKVQELDV